MPTSLIVPLATAGIQYGASQLFGGGGDATAPLTSFAAPGIDAGGLSGSGKIKASPDRLAIVENIARTFGNQADVLAGLRPRVAPGISDLRLSRLAEVENARTASVSNLRDNLARRRVLGSSFGQDAMARADAEFAQQKERVTAESLLQEMEMTTNLLQQEFTARRGAFQTGLDEMNLEADVAVKLTGKVTETLGANARMLALLNSQQATASGKLFGEMFNPVAKAGGAAFGNFFSPSSGVLSGGLPLGFGGIGSA